MCDALLYTTQAFMGGHHECVKLLMERASADTMRQFNMGKGAIRILYLYLCMCMCVCVYMCVCLCVRYT